MGDDHAAFAVGHQIAPMVDLRLRDRGRHDLEILGSVLVGQDQELLAMMLDVIAQPDLARMNQTGGGIRHCQIDDPDLRGLVIAHIDQQEGAGLRLGDRDKHARIGLFVDQNVLALRAAQNMPEHPRGTVVCVDGDVVEALRIGGPDHVAAGFRHHVIKIDARPKRTNADGVEFRAGLVAAPCQHRVVGRMRPVAQIEEILATRQLVPVEHDLLLAALARPAAQDGVLTTAVVAIIVGEWPIRRWRSGVVFLDARPHLGNQQLLQGRRVLQQRGGIAVLGPQQLVDLGRQRFGVTQHVLPVVSPDPCILVAPAQSVGAVRHRALGSDRRLGGMENGHDRS
jgi:hypothetical protein